jgi:RNA polymerase sigma-70 factor (ECF subfamily)
MTAERPFAELMQRMRAGDEQAATDLVRTYEPEIRRAVRAWLTDPRLGRILDSMDICQSVLANFFVRVAAGQFELEQPEQLLRLLVAMARNKLRDHARKLRAERRDQRRLAAGPEALQTVASGQATPSQIVADQDLLRCLLQKLSPEERSLAEQRSLGRNWIEIGRDAGISPDAARMQLHRAVDRAARELHLDEVEHG